MAQTLKAQQAGRSATLRETATQQESLEAAFHRPPKPCDSERRRTLFPCFQAGPVPAYWPTQPPSALVCDFRFYANLADDSLFFIFYYQEGSLAQLLAAKALKMRHWMFHTGYKYWFQRLEEPKVVTSEFERVAPDGYISDLLVIRKTSKSEDTGQCVTSDVSFVPSPSDTPPSPPCPPQTSTSAFGTSPGQYKYWSWNAWSEQVKSDFTFEYLYLDGPLAPKWPYMKNQPEG